MLYSACVKQVLVDCGRVFAQRSPVNFSLLFDVVYNSVLAEDLPRYLRRDIIT